MGMTATTVRRPRSTPTELGQAEWPMKPCRELCVKIQDGTHFSPKLGGDDFLYVTSKSIRFGFLDLDSAERISTAEHRKIFARCDTRFGDLLLTKDGANTGNAALNTLTEEISLLSSVAFLRFDPAVHDARFFLQYVLSHRGQQRLQELMSGNAITRLTLQKIRNFTMPAPSLGEQQVIAAALSDVDGLIASLDRLIAKKRAIKQAAMQQLLTGKTRLPGFEERWITRRLGDIAHIKTGERNNQDKVDDGDYPFFVRSATVERINSYCFDGEAVLVPGEGGIGSIFHYICGRFDVHQRVYKISRFHPDVCGRFIYFAMVQGFGKHAMQNSVKATVDSLRLPTFKAFEIRVPVELAEQLAIATTLDNMASGIDALERRRDKAKAIKQGMMQALLTGRVRLPVKAAAGGTA